MTIDDIDEYLRLRARPSDVGLYFVEIQPGGTVFRIWTHDPDGGAALSDTCPNRPSAWRRADEIAAQLRADGHKVTHDPARYRRAREMAR